MWHCMLSCCIMHLVLCTQYSDNVKLIAKHCTLCDRIIHIVLVRYALGRRLLLFVVEVTAGAVDWWCYCWWCCLVLLKLMLLLRLVVAADAAVEACFSGYCCGIAFSSANHIAHLHLMSYVQLLCCKMIINKQWQI